MMSGQARKKQLKLKVQLKLQIFNLNQNLSQNLNPNLLLHQLLNNLKVHGVKVRASLSPQIQLRLLIIQITQIQHQEDNNPNQYSKALPKKTIKNRQKEKVGENDNFTFFRSLFNFHNFYLILIISHLLHLRILLMDGFHLFCNGLRIIKKILMFRFLTSFRTTILFYLCSL